MKQCQKCGNVFDEFEDEEYFRTCIPSVDYHGLRRTLCAGCAINAINGGDRGIHFEVCDKCGREFDVPTEKELYFDKHGYKSGDELSNHWTLYNHYCSKCVIDDLERDSEDEVNALMEMLEDMLNEK